MESAGMTANKKVYALIGGIASGKTAVSDILGELGACIVDADVISRKVTAVGSAGEKAFIKHFPDCVIDGVPNRKLIREKVFNDEKALKTLNKITHPLILAEIDRQVAESSCTTIVVMPLPIGLSRYDGVLNVYTPIEKRIDRIIKRDNITKELALNMINAQLSDEQAAEKSDFTFVNDGNLDKLRQSVTKWWNIFVEK
ncbi:MAG: dephospho-CoA kinase [Clostridia bacterium]|nr:dephospho-CoA kinase [Clostridia bacterium]